MIHYAHIGSSSWRLLLNLHGSILPICFCRTLITGYVVYLISHYRILEVFGLDFTNCHTLLGYFLQISGLALAFYVNQAFNRYSEARTHVQNMSNSWADVVNDLINIDTIFRSKSENEAVLKGHIYRSKIFHLASLLHALAIQYLLDVDLHVSKLEILGGLSSDTTEALGVVDDQVYYVFHWMSAEIVKRYSSNTQLYPASMLMRPLNLLSSGLSAFNQACKIEDTPFVFPYIQLIHLIDWILLILIPITLASIKTSLVIHKYNNI